MATATTTAIGTTTHLQASATVTHYHSHGLSQSGKIAIGVGLAVGGIIFIGICCIFFLRRPRASRSAVDANPCDGRPELEENACGGREEIGASTWGDGQQFFGRRFWGVPPEHTVGTLNATFSQGQQGRPVCVYHREPADPSRRHPELLSLITYGRRSLEGEAAEEAHRPQGW
jgi:hypothetical protein